LTWFTPCWAVLARVKAAESQRPKGTKIQIETVYCLSAADVLVRQRPAGAAEAVVHGATVQGRRRHGRRRRRRHRHRRRRRRPRSRQAADEDLESFSMATLSGTTKLHLKSRARATSNLRMPSWLRVAVKDVLW
jgi:hypothetical protein